MNDNTVLRIKVPAHLYESVKEQLTLSEAKKGKHNLGAGMEIVKEKKMKAPKQSMKKVDKAEEADFKKIESALSAVEKSKFPNVDFDEIDKSEKYSGLYYSRGTGEHEGKEVDVTIYIDGKTLEVVDILVEQVQETEQVEEGLMDMLRSVSDKVAYDIFLDTPKGMSKEDRAKNIQSCITDANNKKKTDPKIDRDDLIVNCLREKGWKFAYEGSQPGMSAMGGKWAEGKKDRTMEELKKAKDMLEMKIKKMEESLNEKKHKEEDEEQ